VFRSKPTPIEQSVRHQNEVWHPVRGLSSDGKPGEVDTPPGCQIFECPLCLVPEGFTVLSEQTEVWALRKGVDQREDGDVLRPGVFLRAAVAIGTGGAKLKIKQLPHIHVPSTQVGGPSYIVYQTFEVVNTPLLQSKIETKREADFFEMAGDSFYIQAILEGHDPCVDLRLIMVNRQVDAPKTGLMERLGYCRRITWLQGHKKAMTVCVEGLDF